MFFPHRTAYTHARFDVTAGLYVPKSRGKTQHGDVFGSGSFIQRKENLNFAQTNT